MGLVGGGQEAIGEELEAGTFEGIPVGVRLWIVGVGTLGVEPVGFSQLDVRVLGQDR